MSTHDDEPFRPVYEFDCKECGRHIVVLTGRESWKCEGLCSLCVHLPAWFNDPDLRAVFDPDGLARPPSKMQ